MKGSYTLVMACEKPFKIKIGKAGQAQIERSLYLYTGSALGRGGTSLERRVSRHYRKNKQIKWHIDYLTARPEITIKMAICLHSKKRFECQINQLIISKLYAKPVLLHAGATDCRCAAHLLFLSSPEDINEIASALEQIYSRFGKTFRL